MLLHRFLTTDRGDAFEPSNGPGPTLRAKYRLKSPRRVPREAHLPRVLSHPDARRIGSACPGQSFAGRLYRRVVSVLVRIEALVDLAAAGSGGVGPGLRLALRSRSPPRRRSGNRFARAPFLAPRSLRARVSPGTGRRVSSGTMLLQALGPVRLRVRLRGSFSFGLAVPRTQVRILARRLEGSVPKQSLPRVMWSPGNPGSDDCAPLAASAVRRVRSEDLSCGFSDTARGHRRRPDRACAFPCSFRGFPHDPAGWLYPFDT